MRDQVLRDHADLRSRLEHLRAAADAVLVNEADCADLAREAQALTDALSSHMDWEDVHLAGALRGADTWGAERVARLAREHRDQRAQLTEVVASLDGEANPSPVWVRRLLSYAEQLLADMAEEESTVLDLALFRDDAAGVRIEIG